MKKSRFAGLLPLTALLIGVAGCDDSYSESMVYALRTDPIFKSRLGDKYNDPDQPGQFPILTLADLNDSRNPFFSKNKEKTLLERGIVIDPNLVSDADRQKIDGFLTEMFGTPAHPKVVKPADVSQEDFKYFHFDRLEAGSKLYRVHCLHCHGVTGDGRGPTARWVNPHPRDYRMSRFKFQSVDQTGVPTPPHRDDLLRILEIGVEGTAMPSFIMLPPEEREDLVAYVTHLSMRGRVEYDTFLQAFESSKGSMVLKSTGLSLKESMTFYHADNVASWLKSRTNQIKIPEYPYKQGDEAAFKASVERGRQIFVSPPASFGIGDACLTCHVDFGRQSQFLEDDWGTFSKPNNLLQGVYRGGRRPVDIFHRIHSGIPPSGMVSFGKNLTREKSPDPKANTEPIWDLVNFVQVLGNPTMRKAMGIYVD